MDPILIVVILVIVVGAGAFYYFRRGTAAERLPPGDRAPPKRIPAPPTPVEKRRKPSDVTVGYGEPKAEPPGRPAPPAAEEELDARLTPPPDAPLSGRPPSVQDVEALKQGLKTTRGGFIAKLAQLFGKKPDIDPALLDQIEEVLIGADIGVKTSQQILEALRGRLERKELSDPDRVWEAIRQEALGILGRASGRMRLGKKPAVIVVVGVNGVGKTTTIGKLASRFQDEGKKVVLAAGDTFRAAAVLQLEVWGRRVGCPVVKGKERADPGSVIFEAIKKAQDDAADVVIADTAGRLHTKLPLMEELKKVFRTAEKALDGRAPDEVLLVLDSTNGQNAIQQAQMFKEALPVSGIALTKLDGTAKGGVILGIVQEHGLPVRFIGIGERVEDLREFDAPSFVAALFAKPDDESMAA